MATYGTILENVESRLEALGPVHESTAASLPTVFASVYRHIQDLHNWVGMEAVIRRTTTPVPASLPANFPVTYPNPDPRQLGSKPDDWKESRDHPYIIYPDGRTVEIDWLDSESQAVRAFDYDLKDKGRPRYIRETANVFEVYPFSDSKGGANGGAGEYHIFLPYWAYLPAPTAFTDESIIMKKADMLLEFAVFGEALKLQGRTELGMLWALSPRPWIQPASQADREFHRLLRQENLQAVPSSLTLLPARDVYYQATRRQRR